MTGAHSSDELPFMLKYGDPDLIDCGCGDKHRRSCLRERAERQREHELAHALRSEDIRWLNGHGWDGRF